jgi:hypothetical protein
MSPAIIADLLLLLHFAFILFVLFGGLLVVYRYRFAWLHVPMFLWGAVVNIASLPCPLTPLENHYRQLAGQAGYQGGFVEHYIAALIYPDGLTADLGLVVGIGTLLWNIAIYSLVVWRLRR